MRTAWKSDRGVVRENNEDFVLADPEHGLFLLADGMGGGPAGEVASELAARAAHDALLSQLALLGSGNRRMLADALAAAHSAVAKRAVEEPRLKGMGTTLEIVLVQGGEALVCHLGDSRVYLYRGGKLRQLTTDDNYAALLVQNRMAMPEEIPARYRHLLTQVVGLSEELVPELRHVELKPGDLLLACSDGLNEALSDREVEEVLERFAGDPERCAQALVEAANGQGGTDNVSVLLVEPVPAVGRGTMPAIFS